MKTIKERLQKPSKQQTCAESLANERITEAEKIASQAVKRARLVQNKLFQEERSPVYRKVF